MLQSHEICVIGGAGHVGLPLGVAFADAGCNATLFDINEKVLEQIRSGVFPFVENGGDERLRRTLDAGKLHTSSNPESIASAEYVILIIGTPVDEYLNPTFNRLLRTIEKYIEHFRDGQTVILRSTVYPGTSARVQDFFHRKGKNISVAFCPERIVQGNAFEELKNFPQIVSAFEPAVAKAVGSLFSLITHKKIVTTKPIEAELAKLYCNAWRYIKFAVANQFYMIASDHDVNYRAVYEALSEEYPRMQDIPRPGFAAGPCLLKDTMQLSAFANNSFYLGHSAMLVNEGLPNYIVSNLKRRFPLKHMSVGILGMAFKAESDDKRDSLSYKLRKVLHTECRQVLCHDEFIQDAAFLSQEDLLEKSDIIILAAPHKRYKSINPQSMPHKHFVDIWHFWEGAETYDAQQDIPAPDPFLTPQSQVWI